MNMIMENSGHSIKADAVGVKFFSLAAGKKEKERVLGSQRHKFYR